MFCPSCNYDLRTLAATTCPECGRAFNPADPSTFLASPRSPLPRILKRIFFALAILVICGIVFAIWSVYRAAHQAIIAEERLHVSSMVCDLIAEHVEQSPTHSWPTSWADLEKLPPRENIYAWPRQADKVRALVAVDFTTTVSAVLSQTPETCTAIKVTPGPNWSNIPQRWMYTLFDRLRAATNTPEPIKPRSRDD